MQRWSKIKGQRYAEDNFLPEDKIGTGVYPLPLKQEKEPFIIERATEKFSAMVKAYAEDFLSQKKVPLLDEQISTLLKRVWLDGHDHGVIVGQKIKLLNDEPGK